MKTCIKCNAELPDNAVFCLVCGKKQTVSDRNPRRRGNGTGTAFRRGKTWTAQITRYTTRDENGKLKRVYQTKGGFATKRDALAYIDNLKSNQTKRSLTLLELYETWSENSLPKLSTDKQKAYKKARERLEPIIDRQIDTLTTLDLQTVINEQAHTYYTARDMKTVLSHLYNIACVNQLVPTNLSKHLTLPDLNETEGIPFTRDEVQTIWGAYLDGNIFCGYLLIMIYSGMMPGELFACKKEMIDFEKCEIYGCGKKTKTRKDNPIVFADCVKPVLEEFCETVDGDFIQPLSENEWYKQYHKELAKIGVRDLPPYSCRHTTGTEAAKQNLSAPTIQRIMRHARITTSQRYIHFGSTEAHDGINAITGQKD